MTVEPFDPQAVIAQLEARRTAFNAATDEAISALMRLAAVAGIGGVVMDGIGIPNASGPNLNYQSPDSYYGLAVSEAAKKYLRSARRKLTNKEIADGLEAVGFIHNSKDLANNVGTALWRAEREGDTDLVRHGRYWLLTEWGVRKSKPRRSSDSQEEPPAEPEPEIEPELEIEPEV